MPPTRPRGMGPISPRDHTGRVFQKQQQAILDKAKIETDSAQEIKRSYDKGWDDAVGFIMSSYDVFERETEDSIEVS